MSDNLIVSDEEAKAIQESAKLGAKALEIVEGAGGWISDVLGDVPKNLVGVLGGDRLAEYRRANLEKISEKAKAKNRARGVTHTERVSLVIALPLFEAAAEESREELQERWACLLAAAMDPARLHQVRRAFIATLQAFEPIDVRVLMAISKKGREHSSDLRADLAREIGISHEQVDISLDKLRDLKCLLDNRRDFTAYGTELLRAVND